jgi:homocysteine S-methyltransferase
MPTLRHEIQQRPLLLDGGLSTTIESAGHDISDDLWSARLLLDDPSAIADAHTAFFSAGADIATTATYQATFEGFAARGIEQPQATELMKLAVRLARDAADQVEGRPTWVAASIGPYGAMLADGSEYTGLYGLTVHQLRAFHRPRLQLLAEAGADVLAVETLPSAVEVEAVLAEISGTGSDCWISVTITGGRTRAGDPLSDVFAVAGDVDEVVAVGVNCSSPQDATEAVELAAASGLPVVVYPNSGEAWNAKEREWGGAPNGETFDVAQWVNDGARVVGGCCRVMPTDIAAMRKTLDVIDQ